MEKPEKKEETKVVTKEAAKTTPVPAPLLQEAPVQTEYVFEDKGFYNINYYLN